MPFHKLFAPCFRFVCGVRMVGRAVALGLVCALAAAGCSYKVEVRQGSEQLLNSLEDLRPGMHRREVRTLLGVAAVPRLLRDDILLYTYQHRAAGFKDDPQQRTVELVFDENDLLSEVRVLHDDYNSDQQASE